MACSDVMPTISVIIPVFNSVKTIEKALLSVIDQHYEKIELIVLDAGSTDGTVDIIKRYAAAIHYWHSKPDAGAYDALNQGAQLASGDLVAQLMADDWFEAGIFALIAKAALATPASEIYSCGGRFVSFDETSQTYKTLTTYTSRKQLALDFYHICFAIPAMSSRFIRNSLIKKIGLFHSKNAEGKQILSADREFLLRAIAAGAEHSIIEFLGHTYFSHAASATFSKNRTTQMRICLEHMTIAEKYLVVPELSIQQRRLLRYWYNDQSVRLMLFKLQAMDFAAAWDVAKQGLQQFKLAWPLAVFSIPCKIIAKKAYLQVAGLLK